MVLALSVATTPYKLGEKPRDEQVKVGQMVSLQKRHSDLQRCPCLRSSPEPYIIDGSPEFEKEKNPPNWK